MICLPLNIMILITLSKSIKRSDAMLNIGDLVTRRDDDTKRQYYIRWIYQDVAFLIPETGSMDDEIEVPLSIVKLS
jgi:hypothetical protein